MNFYLFRTYTSSCYAMVNTKTRTIVWQNRAVLEKDRSQGEITLGVWIPLGAAVRNRIENQFKTTRISRVRGYHGRSKVGTETPLTAMWHEILNSMPLMSQAEFLRLRKLVELLPQSERSKLVEKISELQTMLGHLKPY